MKLSFPSKNTEEKKQAWQWLSCKQPKTLSFRASNELIKTINSVYYDPCDDEAVIPDTWFTTSSEATNMSTRSEGLLDGEESNEVVVNDVMLSDRLFFEPEETRSILKKKKVQILPFEDSVVMAMESKDPWGDFRRSMEEIVETYGLKEWECLDELLGWYLRVNGKKNHGFIVGAFVDLLVGMVSSSTNYIISSDSDSFASCVSSPSSPLCPLQEKEDTNDEDNIVV